MKIITGYFMVRTQGLGRDRGAPSWWPEESMRFSSGASSCGDIKDGVSFDIGRGSWVIEYSDLIAMAEAAKEARENNKRLGL